MSKQKVFKIGILNGHMVLIGKGPQYEFDYLVADSLAEVVEIASKYIPKGCRVAFVEEKCGTIFAR